MGKRDELIAQYAEDLRSKCGMEPDMDLLTKVTIGCGPAIYDADASTVAATQPGEIETVKKNFLMKKLGLADGAALDSAIDSVIETYGKSERNKYRAVVYYMLVKHFGRRASTPEQGTPHDPKGPPSPAGLCTSLAGSSPHSRQFRHASPLHGCLATGNLMSMPLPGRRARHSNTRECQYACG